MVFLRFIIASFGGYLFTALVTTTLAYVLPFENKREIVQLATMLSFIIWLLFILYSFSSVKLKNLLLLFSISSMSLFLLNTYVLAPKGV